MVLLAISENILWLICGLGIFQGILLAGFLYFHPKSDRSVNKFLAFFILFFSVMMMLPFTMRLSWQNSLFQQPVPLLLGPLLYLYLRSFKETITWRKAFPHFIMFFVFYIPGYFNLSAWAAKYPDAKEVPAEAIRSPLTLILNSLKFAQSVIYYFLSRKVLSSYQRSIKQLFSETSHFDLKWARLLVNGFIINVFAAIILFFFIQRYPEQFNLLLLLMMMVGAPYIYLVTYKGILQPTIWQAKPELKKKEVEEEIHEAEEIVINTNNSERARPVKNRLDENKADDIVERITFLMEEEKLYQESELTLQQLAGKLQLPVYLVSQAINEGTKKNFYELVNGYRVEEAKRLLLDSKNRNYTILSVGFEAGFNSKTTFNTVFKKFTGLTPTDFRDKQKVEV